MTDKELDRMFEVSKDDHASRMIVGSDVRELIGDVWKSRTCIRRLESALTDLVSWTNLVAHRGIGGHGPTQAELHAVVAEAREKMAVAMRELKL